MKRFLMSAILFTSAIILTVIGCENTATESAGSPEPATPRLGLMKGTDVMFTGEEDHSITLQAAQQMMSAFQKDNPYNTYAWYFGRVAIEKILAQEGCVGIRIYGGFKADGEFSPLLIGATAEGKEIIGGGLSKSLADSIDVGIAELAHPCPPGCP